MAFLAEAAVFCAWPVLFPRMEVVLRLRRLQVVVLVLFCATPALFAQRTEDALSLGPQVFGGYSEYHPGGKVNGTAVPNFNSGVAGEFEWMNGRWTGLLFDGAVLHGSSGTAYNFNFGVRLQAPFGRVTPFFDGMIGVQHITSNSVPSQNTPAYIAGGGVDVRLTKHLSLRPIQILFINTTYNAETVTGDKQYLNGTRMQAGLVYRFERPGGVRQQPAAACDIENARVISGEPVCLNVQASGFRTRKLHYSFAATGGKVAANGSVATVDTKGVDAGSYLIKARVESSSARHLQSADCQAEFAVEAASAAPPAETAKPAEEPVKPAEEAAPAKETAPVVETAPAAAPEKVSTERDAPKKFASVLFERDVKRPARVDNEAKGELDRFADALAAAPDMKAVVIGRAAKSEGGSDAERRARAAQRAVNTKYYLTLDKGIDPKRIEPRVGSISGKLVELWLVAPGASLPEEGTVKVDEARVKGVPRTTAGSQVKPKAKHAAKHSARKAHSAAKFRALPKQ